MEVANCAEWERCEIKSPGKPACCGEKSLPHSASVFSIHRDEVVRFNGRSSRFPRVSIGTRRFLPFPRFVRPVFREEIGLEIEPLRGEDLIVGHTVHALNRLKYALKIRSGGR